MRLCKWILCTSKMQKSVWISALEMPVVLLKLASLAVTGGTASPT
uniref:Uncharacterized protein n=1 Tax=Anguilla anguilla TaxID=7936 RepID=A0A0E9T738_ANGAN